MELHEIESNGKKFTFNVVTNSTEPCPECGVPACGKEDIIWYEDNGQRFAIIFDGGYFDVAIEELIGKNLDLLKSGSLPPPCQMRTKKQLVILDFSVSVKNLNGRAVKEAQKS